MDVAQHRAIRLARAAGARVQLGNRLCHREVEAERVNLAEVEIRRTPPRRQAGHPRNLWRHVRVAVAIPADPRAEPDRRRVERQGPAGRCPQGGIERPQVARQRIPDRLLEDQEAARHLVERVGTPGPYLFGLPGGDDLAPQPLDRLGALRNCQVRSIQLHQRRGDLQVLVDQRSTRDLGRMGREDELDPQRAHRLVERVGADLFANEARERPPRRKPVVARPRDSAGSRGAAGRDGAVRRCWRA